MILLCLGGSASAESQGALVFFSTRDFQTRLYSMDLGSGEVRPLTTLGNEMVGEYAPVWSPDGQQIAYFSIEDNELVLRVADRDGNNSRALISGVIPAQ